MTRQLIKMDAIKKVFVSDDMETHALSNIHLTIQQGEYVSITGPSGCGKSTLLSVMGLLDSSSAGQYFLSSLLASELDSKQRSQIRNKEIGFIFQSFNLISDMTVRENVELPLTYRTDLTKQQRIGMVDEALQSVGMQHRVNHFPAQLSGGQQQRVAIARAIAGKPSLLLADEPTGNLDSKNAAEVMALLDNLHANGATICIVTHDPRSAQRAHRIVQMMDGQIVSDISCDSRPLQTLSTGFARDQVSVV
ncbi:MAG: ABC transporter ATP-binding protein [Cellvibrio sp. 79]|nr:MAG: ABC transporter ATP-binding protein [Cellvibrio sp. 79]